MYYLLDLILFILIVYLSIYAYKHKYYLKLFNYFKLFFILSLSAKLSPFTAFILKKLFIIQADTYFISILIAFTFNLFLLFYFFKYIIKFINKFINSEKIKTLFAKLLCFFEVLILSTFIYYMTMQIYLPKKYLQKHVNKTYSYKYIKNFYSKFLNKDFILMILNSDTGTNHHEVIFKSFKNSL